MNLMILLALIIICLTILLMNTINITKTEKETELIKNKIRLKELELGCAVCKGDNAPEPR